MFMWIFCFFVVSAIEVKQLLKVLVISLGLAIVSVLSRESTFDTLDATVFREIKLNSFPCVLNIIPIFFQNIYHNKHTYFSSEGWRVSFYIFGC